MGTRVSLQSLNLIFADVMTDRNESLDQRFFREMAKMRNVFVVDVYYGKIRFMSLVRKKYFLSLSTFSRKPEFTSLCKKTYSLLALYISSSLSSLCVLTQIGITF